MEDIYPLGYPTEQFISKIKNDVYQAFETKKAEKRKALAQLRSELAEGGAAAMAYARLQFEELSAQERNDIEGALLRYCELDTLAMVMILKAWMDWA